LFGNIVVVSRTQIQESYPTWANVMRLFWLLVFGGAGALWLWRLVRIRRLEATEARSAAACLGLALVTVANVAFFEGGIANLRRSLTYGAFLLIPFAFIVLRQLGRQRRRTAVLGIGLLLILLAPASFFGIGFNAPRWIYYNIESVSGRWVRSAYGRGAGLEIYADVPVFWNLQLDVPDAVYVLPRSFLRFEHPEDPDVVWQALGEVIAEFGVAPRSGKLAIFVYSSKMPLYTGQIYGISPIDARWDRLNQQASAESSEVYDNGAIRIYAREGP